MIPCTAPMHFPVTPYSTSSFGFYADGVSQLHPDIFDHFDISTEDHISSLTSSQSTGDEATAADSSMAAAGSIDPRQLYVAGPSTPLEPSTMLLNRADAALVASPTSMPDTPKISKDSFRRASRRNDSALSVSFAAETDTTADLSTPQQSKVRQRSSVPPLSALKGTKSKTRSSTSQAARQTLFADASSSTNASSSRRARMQIPLALPMPRFAPGTTDPYVDVAEHLARVGLSAEAQQARSAGWTASYAIKQVRSMLGDRWRLSLLGDDADSSRNAQALVTAAAQSKFIKVQQVVDGEHAADVAPTHILAVVPSQKAGPEKRSESKTSDSKASEEADNGPKLVPVHSLLYALHCRSLPDRCFDANKDPQPASMTKDQGGDHVQRGLRVIQLRVKEPATFAITNEYIYTGSAQRLLNSLVPLRFINESIAARTAAAAAGSQPSSASLQNAEQGGEDTPKLGGAASQSQSQSQPTERSTSTSTTTTTTAPPLNPQAQAIQALADLSTKQLLKLLGTITSVYTNGVALGLADVAYWRTLAAAWELVVGGLAIRKGRQADGELKAVRRAMKGLGLHVPVPVPAGAGGEGGAGGEPVQRV